MAESLGQKHTCFVCSAKFYDLEQPEPICPKCGENQKLAPKDAHKKAGDKARKKKVAKKKTAAKAKTKVKAKAKTKAKASDES